MEENVVKAIGVDLNLNGFLVVAVDTVSDLLGNLLGLGNGVAVQVLLSGLSRVSLGVFFLVSAVRVVESAQVAFDSPRAVNNGVFSGKIGLVEVPCVGHVGTVNGFHDKRSIGTDQGGESTGTTDGSRTTFCVNGDITGEDDGVSSVPRFRLNPVDGVEEGGGGTVACVLGVDTLDIGVSGFGEEVHQDSLDGLGLVDDGLCTDIETTDGLGVDVVLLQQAVDGCSRREPDQRRYHCTRHSELTRKSERVDVLSVIGACHELLSQTDGVLALGDTIEFFQFLFGDALIKAIT